MTDGDAAVRTACLSLLVKAIKNQAPLEIADRVRPLVDDSDPQVAVWAAVAMWNWDAARPEVRLFFRKSVSAANAAVRRQAVGILAKTLPDEEDRRLLKTALSDPIDEVRAMAVSGLLKLNHAVEQALERLPRPRAEPEGADSL